MVGVVYRIVNLVNGTVYIGQTTKTVSQRFTEHVYDAVGNRRRKHNSYLHEAIQKYGKDNFSINVLNVCLSEDALDSVEKFYIKYFDTLRPNGYNLSLGGQGVMHGRSMSIVSRNKIGKALKGHPGYKFSHTDEAKKKISLSLIGNKRSVGRVHSTETNLKMRLSHLGRKYKKKSGL